VQKVGTETLNQLKNIRSGAVELSSRVKKFKEELEDILKDDQDMMDMYLGRREQARHARHAALAAAAANHEDTRSHSSSAGQRAARPKQRHDAGAAPLPVLAGPVPVTMHGAGHVHGGRDLVGSPRTAHSATARTAAPAPSPSPSPGAGTVPSRLRKCSVVGQHGTAPRPAALLRAAISPCPHHVT
jgi:hypothetical protein